MIKRFLVLICCFWTACISSCAFDVVKVKQVPTSLNASQTSKKSLKLVDEVKVSFGTGYSRKLKSGTRWDYVGHIEQGDVYQTKDQILTIEASNIFEAYIVVLDDELVGFYLPVENTYSPAASPKKLHLEPID